MSKVVIHVSGGVAEIATAPSDIEVVILDFDSFEGRNELGSKKDKHRCPKCYHESSTFEWNVATEQVVGEGVTLMHVHVHGGEFAEPEFTCPVCFESSSCSEIIEENDPQ